MSRFIQLCLALKVFGELWNLPKKTAGESPPTMVTAGKKIDTWKIHLVFCRKIWPTDFPGGGLSTSLRKFTGFYNDVRLIFLAKIDHGCWHVFDVLIDQHIWGLRRCVDVLLKGLNPHGQNFVEFSLCFIHILPELSKNLCGFSALRFPNWRPIHSKIIHVWLKSNQLKSRSWWLIAFLWQSNIV